MVATRFSDDVYLAETSLEEDGLEVREFIAVDAELKGLELHGDWELVHSGSDHLGLAAGSSLRT